MTPYDPPLTPSDDVGKVVQIRDVDVIVEAFDSDGSILRQYFQAKSPFENLPKVGDIWRLYRRVRLNENGRLESRAIDEYGQEWVAFSAEYELSLGGKCSYGKDAIKPAKDDRIDIQLDVPAEVGQSVVLSAIEKLILEMDGLHRALGGHGLKVDSLEVHEECGVPEGVQ